MTKKSTSTSSLPEPPNTRPHVPIRAADETPHTFGQGERFLARSVMLSRLGGATQFHVNQCVIPAGKQSGPFHYHVREEEHFYILGGRCVMRSGDDSHEMHAGDYVCFPAGTKVAHAFENPFDEDCTMLAMGSFDPHELAIYPDSGKARVRGLDNAMVKWPQDSLDYWHGEPVDTPVQ